MDSVKVAAAPLMSSEQQSELRQRSCRSDRSSTSTSSRPNSSLDRGDPLRRSANGSGKTSLSTTSSNSNESNSTSVTSTAAAMYYGGTPPSQHDSPMLPAALLAHDGLSDVRVGSPTLPSTSGSSFSYYKMDRSRMVETPERREKMKREKLKDEKMKYRKEKKRAAKEILSTLRDPSVVLMADYLKVRGMLKSWTKFWCVLNPGILILYKSQKRKSGHWVGTIILNSAKLIERPSKKDGFCFKIYHPLDQSIWAQKGPEAETLGAITQPLMYSSAIFRGPLRNSGENLDGRS